MIEWEFFSKRRNIDLSAWIIEFNIENYEQLKELCHSKGVKPPLQSTFQAAQAVVIPTVGNLVEREITEPKKSPPKKTTRKRKTTRTPRKRSSK